MAWQCSGTSHASLINNLRLAGIIKSDRVFKAMMAVDRGGYVPRGADPYEDSPQLIGLAPVVLSSGLVAVVIGGEVCGCHAIRVRRTRRGGMGSVGIVDLDLNPTRSAGVFRCLNEATVAWALLGLSARSDLARVDVWWSNRSRTLPRCFQRKSWFSARSFQF